MIKYILMLLGGLMLLLALNQATNTKRNGAVDLLTVLIYMLSFALVLGGTMSWLSSKDPANPFTPETTPIVKAADKLSAHIKCLEEQKAGNTEFDTAARQTWEAMKQANMPELDWFLDHCLAPFALNLDQL